MKWLFPYPQIPFPIQAYFLDFPGGKLTLVLIRTHAAWGVHWQRQMSTGWNQLINFTWWPKPDVERSLRRKTRVNKIRPLSVVPQPVPFFQDYLSAVDLRTVPHPMEAFWNSGFSSPRLEYLRITMGVILWESPAWQFQMQQTVHSHYLDAQSEAKSGESDHPSSQG